MTDETTEEIWNLLIALSDDLKIQSKDLKYLRDDLRAQNRLLKELLKIQKLNQERLVALSKTVDRLEKKKG